jgi:hypothetical protein
LLVAGLLTLSAWDIEFSRYARMYAPFEFFYLLTLLSIWRYRVVEENLAGGVLCIVLALVNVSLHDLGYTLALAFLVPLMLRRGRPLRELRPLVFPAIAFSTTAVFYFAWQRIQNYSYNLAAIRAGAEPVGTAVDASDKAPAFVQAITSYVHVPEPSLFRELYSGIPLAAVACLAGPLWVAALFCWLRRASLDATSMLLLALIALACGLQLFNIALLTTLALAFLKREGIRAFLRPELRFAIGLVGVLFFVWLALGFGFGLNDIEDKGLGSRFTETVRQLLDYPRFFVFWGFVNAYPLMSIPALVGGLWAFDCAAGRPSERSALFLLTVFAIPMILNGVFRTIHETFRYDVPFGPLYFTFVALGLTQWRQVLAAWNKDSQPSLASPRTAWTTGLLAALVLAVDMNPLRSWLVTQGEYASEGTWYRLFHVQRSFPDYRSTASYVADHAEIGDTIIVFQCREYFNYLGRLDYCVASNTYFDGDRLKQTYVEGNVRRDLYLSTPMIMNLYELETALQEAPGTKWLIAPDSMMKKAVGEDIRRFVQNSQEHVVYVSRDGDDKVYRF